MSAATVTPSFERDHRYPIDLAARKYAPQDHDVRESKTLNPRVGFGEVADADETATEDNWAQSIETDTPLEISGSLDWIDFRVDRSKEAGIGSPQSSP
ncbi:MULTISPECIES: hypothetical protein [Bradyrhizobium]|uniref:Uncharacterized protein n=1 Tax=Bradyrhizobium vignae TaxID=1549949 RepID=A0A2U3PS74_9BRAD|nr:hypothetical protein [Bradyrhizobium vignae]MBP0111147.1 hypothetical protein [Bradyrhizobium vignae]SPP92030.1 protein of unknown function [Bradyrhizobium vignae]